MTHMFKQFNMFLLTTILVDYLMHCLFCTKMSYKNLISVLSSAIFVLCKKLSLVKTTHEKFANLCSWVENISLDYQCIKNHLVQSNQLAILTPMMCFGLKHVSFLFSSYNSLFFTFLSILKSRSCLI